MTTKPHPATLEALDAYHSRLITDVTEILVGHGFSREEAEKEARIAGDRLLERARAKYAAQQRLARSLGYNGSLPIQTYAKTEAGEAFEVTSRDGRIMRLHGVDVTPARPKNHEPVIGVRRAPDPGRGTIKATVLNACVCGGRSHGHGDVVEIKPEEFEALRRARLVARYREPHFLVHVLRPWQTGLSETMLMPASEMERRRAAGDVALADPTGRSVMDLTAEERTEPVKFVAFQSTRLTLDLAETGSSAGFPRYYAPPAESLPVLRGEMVHIPRAIAEFYQRKDFGTVVEPGDVVLIDGNEQHAT